MNPFSRVTGRLVAFLALFLCSGVSRAQLISSYTFNQSSGTYSALSTTTSNLLDSGALLDEGRYFISLPFSFYVDGTAYNTAYVHTNGYIALGTTDPGANEYYGISHSGTGFISLAGMSANLAGMTGAGTRLHTATIGTSPNRTFVVEWKNFGYPGTTVLDVNFQIRMQESTNVFEVVYGSCSHGGTSSALSVQVGIRGLSSLHYFHRAGGSGFSTWTGTSTASSPSASILYTSGRNPATGFTYTFTPPPTCAVPVQPGNLVLTPNFTSVSGTFTASNPAANKYLLVRSNGPLTATPVNGTYYNTNASIGNGIVISSGTSTSFTDNGLTMNTGYTYTVFPYNDVLCIGAPTYNTALPLSASVVTPRPRSYTWNATSGFVGWANASNWTPARTHPHNLDTMIFNNGGNSSVSLSALQTVDVIRVSNNTTVNLVGGGTFIVPGLSYGRSLIVDTSSSMTISGNLVLGAVSGGQQKTANCYGAVTVDGSSVFNAANAAVVFNTALNLLSNGIYNCASGVTTINGTLDQSGSSLFKTDSGPVTLNGVVNLNGSSIFDLGRGPNTQINGTVNCIGSGSRMAMITSFIPVASFNGGAVYNHMRDGGNIPYAVFNQNSTINITGAVNTSPTFENLGGPLGQVIWNCAGQNTMLQLRTAFSIYRGGLVIQNTGSYVLQNGASNLNVQGTFTQNGGTFMVSSTNPATFAGPVQLNAGTLDVRYNSSTGIAPAITVLKDLDQAAAHVLTNGGGQGALISFAGTSAQRIHMGGGTAAVPINYALNNAAGVLVSDTLYVNQGANNTVNSGYWLGTGTILYAQGSSLTYNIPGNRIPTDMEWPASYGPSTVSMNATGAFPNNRLIMHGPRALSGNLNLTNGTLQLGSYDVRVDGNITPANTMDSMRMIATEGGGQLLRLVPAATGTQNIDFPIGDRSGIPQYSPVRLQVAGNTTARYIGARVTDAQHPADASTTNFISRYWSFSDSHPGSAFSYKPSLDYPGSELVGNFNHRMNRWNGSVWTVIPSLSSRNGLRNKLDPMNMLSSASQPLQGSDFTGRGVTGNVYSWTGAVNSDYQNALNWNPARQHRDPTDILQWNGGNIDTVKNIPSDTVSQLLFTNNTTTVMQASAAATGSTVYLIAVTDHNTGTQELRVDQGATLISNGNQKSLQIGISGDSCRGHIAGSVILAGNFATGTIGNRVDFNCPGCVSVVTASGYLAAGENANNYTEFSSNDTATLKIHGTYEHKFSTVVGGFPRAAWRTGSNLLVTGYTTSTDGPLLGGQNYYNFTYDCPNQTVVATSTSSACDVIGTMRIVSTGSGEWRPGAGYSIRAGKYFQTGGTINLAPGQSGGRILFRDSVIQSGGRFYNPGAQTCDLEFAGTTGVQEVSFKDNAPAGPVRYRLGSLGGVHLIGTGTLTGAFDINQNGGVHISSQTSTPLITTLPLRYGPATSLGFEGQNYNYDVDTLIYPSITSPADLWISVPGGSVKIPGSRDIPGTLTLLGGALDIGANHISIGSSVSSPGALAWTNGQIRATTGSVTRWYGVTGLPTMIDPNFYYPNTGFYPLYSGNSNRSVSLYFSTSTALSSGGTITVSHSNAGGLTTGLSVADGGYTIGARSNAGWNISTGNGLSMPSATMSMRVTASNLFSVNSPVDLRLMKASSVAGNHITGSGAPLGFMAQRSGLSQSDISSATYYVGGAASDFNPVFISVNDGNWNTASTWNLNAVPDTSSIVYISSGDTVTVNAAAAAKLVHVTVGAMLHATTNTMRVDSAIFVDGTFGMAGATVNLGPAGGGSAPFVINPTGLLEVTSGTLNINGSLTQNSTTSVRSRLVQSGGSIVLDGNAGSVVASSVPFGTAIWGIHAGNLNLTGGSIMIVDPHAGSGSFGGAAAVSVIGNYNRIITPNHTLIIGDGISTTPGSHGGGFNFYDFSAFLTDVGFGNIVINGSPSGVARYVTHNSNGLNVQGDLTINANGVYQGGSALYLGGNLTVNSGGTLLTTHPVFFSNSTGTGFPNRRPQVVRGSGTFTTHSGANFVGMIVNNSSAGGVMMDIGNVSVQNAVNFEKGILHMANNSVLTFKGPAPFNASQTTGWIEGAMARERDVSNSLNTYLFPIGDSTTYSPITIVTVIPGNGAAIRARALTGDHPNLSGSSISPLKSVNRQYVIDTVGTLWSAGGIRVIPGWGSSIVDPGALWPNFNMVRYRNSAWDILNTTLPAPASIQADGISSALLSGIYQVGEYGAAPVITRQPESDTICTGGDAIFTAAATQADGYQWQTRRSGVWMKLGNGGAFAGVNSPALAIYGPDATLNGSVYRCLAYNSYDTTASDTVVLVLNSSILPTIAISSNAGATVCPGQLVRFTASITQGGTAPVYQWRVNGTVAGGNSNIFDWNVGAQDSVNCILTSDLACASPSSVAAGGIKLATSPLVTPSVSISMSPATPVCPGSLITFNATATNAGSAPVYEWVVNGNAAGTNSAVFSSTGFANGDLVRCRLTSNATCLTGNRDSSSIVTVYLKRLPVQPLAITGSSALCGSAAQVYSVVNDTINTSYTWTLPSGWSGSSGTAAITATPGAAGGTVSVVANNACGVSAARSLAVSVGTSPATPSVVSGPAAACNGASVTYSVTADPNISTYAWSLPSGWTGSSTTNSITVTPGSGGGSIGVTGNNSCGTSAASTLSVSSLPAPAQPGTISGTATVCVGSSQTYSVVADPGLTSYNWTLPSGWTGSSTTNSITVTAGSGAGNVSVSGVNGCGTSAARSLAVNAVVLPAQPGTISGSATVCNGSTETYSVVAVPGATSYTWSGPSGWSGSSTTNSIALTAGGTTGGNVSVTANNVCGSSTATSLAVSLNSIPATPGTISGPANPCATTAQTYSVPAVSGAVSYNWTHPSGWSGASTTNSIGLTAGTGAGSVTVSAVNACGSSAAQSVAVFPQTVPAQAAAIVGAGSPCANSLQGYKVPAVSGATSYIWTFPSGWTGSSTTDSIVVTAGPAGTGNITVVASNACGNSASQSLSVTSLATVIPTVNIATVLPPTICAGVPLTLTTSQANGGTSPQYQWFMNGAAVPGGTGSSIIVTPRQGGDTFSVSLLSSAVCPVPAMVNSADLVVTGTPVVTPAVQLSASPAGPVAVGSSVQFTAVWSGAGADSVIVWKRNGVLVAGAGGSVWTAVNVQAGDSVSVEVTNRDACAMPPTVSAGSAISVLPGVGVGAVPGADMSVQVVPNPSDGRFDVVVSLGSQPADGGVEMKLFDALGRLVYRDRGLAADGKLMLRVRLDEAVAAGLYQVVLSVGELRLTRPVLIRR